MLSVALLVLEVAVDDAGDGDDGDAASERMLDEAHVVRGYDLLSIFHDIRATWEGKDVALAQETAEAERAPRGQRPIADWGLAASRNGARRHLAPSNAAPRGRVSQGVRVQRHRFPRGRAHVTRLGHHLHN